MSYQTETQVMRVNKKDVIRMMTKCKDLLLKAHPRIQGARITHKFMFEKIVDFYEK